MYRQFLSNAQKRLKSFKMSFPKQGMERDYRALKEENLMKDFRILVLFLMVLNFVPGIFAVISHAWTEVYISAAIIAVLIFLFCIQKFLRRYIQFVTHFVFITYTFIRLILVSNYYASQTKSRLFFTGYGLASLQSILLLRLPNVSQKVVGMVLALPARFLYMNLYVEPDSFNPAPFLRNLLIDVFIVYTIYTQEIIFRKIYKDFVQKKEELLKFKELLAESLPQSLIVVTYSKNDLLFFNKAFQNTFTPSQDLDCSSPTLNNEAIRASLRSLLVEQSSLREIGSNDAIFSYWEDAKQISLERILARLSSDDYLNDKTISLAASTTTPNDTRRLFEVTLKKVKWDTEDAIAVLFNDITHQEKLIALKLANINKDKVIATVSHELRTPLNGIIGILDIAETKVDNPEVAEYLSLCKDNAHLLLGLVNSILDLQQVSAGKLKLNPIRVDIRKVINGIVQLFAFQCKEKNIFLECEIDKDVPSHIFTDENRLKQILMNLIGNATKFTFKGGVSIKVALHPEDDSRLQISVTDSGIGIKQEDQKHLFKMYGKLKDGESVNKNGVGLGLTISNALAALLNGNGDGIKVQSDHGAGSKFSFEIQQNLQERLGPQTRNGLLDDTDNETTNKGLLFIQTTKTEERKIMENNNDEVCSTQQNEYDEFFAPSDIQSKLGNYVSLKKMIPTESRDYDNDSPRSKEDRQKCHHVLIVDDNPFNLLVARNLFKEFGCQVKTALSGEEAIQVIKDSLSEGIVFKAIFMDCQMPIMDGFETTKILNGMMESEQIPKAVIFAWTANNSEEDVKRCYEAGMVGHLPKPASKMDILKIISKL